jgi:hypothetical protein
VRELLKEWTLYSRNENEREEAKIKSLACNVQLLDVGGRAGEEAA